MAQGLGNSPYSALGLGEQYPQGNATNIGMGGVGISNASPFYLNLQNPALLGTRPPYTVFEVGLQGQVKSLTQRLNNSNQSQRTVAGNLGYLAIGFPANSRWSMSLSLRPHSYVEYQTQQFAEVPGTSSVAEYSYSGSGGLNRAAYATGIRVTKNIFLGAEAAYLFGNITTSSDSRIIVSALGVGTQDSRVTRLNRANYRDIVYKVGAAWRPKLSTNWNLNLGATYDPAKQITASQTEILQQTTLSGIALGNADTLRNNSSGRATLPQQAHVGISLERANRFLVGVDVGFQQWSQYKGYDGKASGLRDVMTVATGIEYTPKPSSTRYRDLITYRAGFQYNQMPYSVSNQAINDMNVSAGFSLPLGAYFVNHATLSLVYGQRGVLTGTQLREQYVRIALGFSLTDRWFRKQVVD
ncbi:membrane protein [Spirosoma luteolum]